MNKFQNLKAKEETAIHISGTEPWMGLEHLPRNTNPELRLFLMLLEKYDQSHIYLKTKHNYSSLATKLQIKITDPDIMKDISKDTRFKDYGLKKDSQGYTTSKSLKVELYASAGLRGSGRLNKIGDKKNNPTNDQQESATIFFFECMFKKNVPPTIEEINKKIGFEFDLDWYYNFGEQYNAFTSHFGVLRNMKIYLDSGKNESNILLNLAKQFGLKDSKDNWNPADIWMMNISKTTITRETKNIVTLAEYNAWLKDKFKSKEIIGVSLKKVPKTKKGKFDMINENNTLPTVDIKANRVLFTDYGARNFIFETTGNIKGFNVRVGLKAKSVKTEKEINIYSEGRMAGTSVQLGAVSAKLVRAEAYANGFDIDRDKKKIFEDPQGYIEKTLPKILKYSVVTHIKKEVPTDELELKTSAFLTYFMLMYLSFTPQQLKKFYYSSAKMNDFSSIHCKLS